MRGGEEMRRDKRSGEKGEDRTEEDTLTGVKINDRRGDKDNQSQK